MRRERRRCCHGRSRRPHPSRARARTPARRSRSDGRLSVSARRDGVVAVGALARALLGALASPRSRRVSAPRDAARRLDGPPRTLRAWSSTAASAPDGDPAVPVLIVGGGPVGLTMSILLSRLGVDSLLIERRAEATTHPQAHFINARTSEVFRPLLGLERHVAAAQPPLEHWRRFAYCTRMIGGATLAVVDHFDEDRVETPIDPESPTSPFHFSQSRLEPALFARAVAAHPRGPAGFRRGAELVGLEQDARGVTARVALGTEPEGEPEGEGSKFGRRLVRASYVVAADGASSSTRRLLGVASSGTPAMQHLVNVHFTSPSLAATLRRGADVEDGGGGGGFRASVESAGAAMLYFVFNPDVVAVVVAHDLRGEGEFVAQIPFFPPTQTLARDFTPRSAPSSSPEPRRTRRFSSEGSRGRRVATRFVRRVRRSRSERSRVDDVRARGGPLPRRARVPVRRRRARVPARGRVRDEHRRAGRAQPRVEARRRDSVSSGRKRRLRRRTAESYGVATVGRVRVGAPTGGGGERARERG